MIWCAVREKRFLSIREVGGAITGMLKKPNDKINLIR